MDFIQTGIVSEDKPLATPKINLKMMIILTSAINVNRLVNPNRSENIMLYLQVNIFQMKYPTNTPKTHPKGSMPLTKDK